MNNPLINQTLQLSQNTGFPVERFIGLVIPIGIFALFLILYIIYKKSKGAPLA